jgi:hypothetical protein
MDRTLTVDVKGNPDGEENLSVTVQVMWSFG